MINMPHPTAIEHYPKSMQVFVKSIHNRIESGKNALIAVVGPTGNGKSWSTITIMVALDLYRYGKMRKAQYYVDHCIFRATDFMIGLNDKNIKKKVNWNWDEAGVDAGTAEHATVKNKAIGWLAQTFRNMQQVVFFTIPTLGMLTPQVRKLIHYYLEAISVDKKRNVCIMKPLKMQYNTRMDKIYYHNLNYSLGDGGFEEVEFMGVPLAQEEILDLYEKKKWGFTRHLNLELQIMLENIEAKKTETPLDKCTDLQREIYRLMTEENVLTQTDLVERIGTSPAVISQNIGYMRRKGLDMSKIHRKIGIFKDVSLKVPQPT